MKHGAGLADFEKDKLVIVIFFIHSLIERSEMIITYDLFSFRRSILLGYQQNIYYYLLLSTIKFNFHASSLEAVSFSKKGSATHR